jgi:peptide-methionine (S)-S-oxide reductase
MAVSIFGSACSRGSVDFKSFPAPAVDLPVKDGQGTQTVVLAGGCFWCTEGVYEQIPGVLSVVSGYAGGTKESATYSKVSNGDTAHAEAIQITFDPVLISYGQILKVFFSVAHDPTTLNRQGNDVGSQYRSAIFYASDDEKRVAEAYIKQLDDAKVFASPIVTKLEKLDAFYEAEAYHQDYVKNNPNEGYVRAVALPKVEKAKKAAQELKATTQPHQ